MTLDRKNLEGKEVNQFIPIDHNAEGLIPVKSQFEGNFAYHDEYMGDHSEHFIIEYYQNGNEKARWNVKDIAWIEWTA